ASCGLLLLVAPAVELGLALLAERLDAAERWPELRFGELGQRPEAVMLLDESALLELNQQRGCVAGAAGDPDAELNRRKSVHAASSSHSGSGSSKGEPPASRYASYAACFCSGFTSPRDSS